MSKLSKDEEMIQNALSEIHVDTTTLARQVKNRLNDKHTATPCGMRRSIILVTAISIMLIATVSASTLGKFDWFIEKFNPDFSEIVTPIEIVCEDKGIRMEVIGAQKYDNKAIVYLSLQDVSGQNRLTEQTEFLDGFYVKMNPNSKGENGEFATSFSTRITMIYFDKERNTVYYEFNIAANGGSSLSDPLTLGSFLVFFDKKSYQYEPIPISLTNLKESSTTSIKDTQIFGGTLNVSDSLGESTKVLTPSNYAPMPHGEADQWISNIGILDGKLHIQIGSTFNSEFGSSDPSIFLKNVNGELIEADYLLHLFANKEHHFLNVKKGAYSDASYKYNEFVFSIAEKNLQDYTLCFTNSIRSGVEGKWEVTANLSDTSEQIHILKNDIAVAGHTFSYMTISPLGLQAIGSYEGDECMASKMSLAFETGNDTITLNDGGGTINSKNKSFNMSWDTTTPIDVASITAVIINGTRIPVK